MPRPPRRSSPHGRGFSGGVLPAPRPARAHSTPPQSHRDRRTRLALREAGLSAREWDPGRAVGIPPHGASRRGPRDRPDVGVGCEASTPVRRMKRDRHRRSAARADTLRRAQLSRRRGTIRDLPLNAQLHRPPLLQPVVVANPASRRRSVVAVPDGNEHQRGGSRSTMYLLDGTP